MATTPTEDKPITGATPRQPSDGGELAPTIKGGLERTVHESARPSHDNKLWSAIRESTAYMGFPQYQHFIDSVMSGREPDPDLKEYEIEKERIRELQGRRGLPFPGVDAYRLLKVSTEVFLMT